jgi:hypothetical protein
MPAVYSGLAELVSIKREADAALKNAPAGFVMETRRRLLTIVAVRQ